MEAVVRGRGREGRGMASWAGGGNGCSEGGRGGEGLTWVEVEAWEVDGGGLIVIRKEVRPGAHLRRVELLIVAEVAVEVHVLEGGGAEEALASAGHQLIRSIILDEVAHLYDPGLENFP